MNSTLREPLPDRPERAFAWLSRRSLVGLAVFAALSLGGYLLISAQVYRIGFPLDDAWIHQTYARNLAELGEWSFIPGRPSAGSTAPLWSALLGIGHAIGLGPYVWTYLLGWAALLAVAAAGGLVFWRLRPQYRRAALGVAVFLALEWHLVWAAGSGMETLVSALLVLIVCGVSLSRRKNWLLLGVLVGLSAWVRPDGITLAGPALWALVFGPSDETGSGHPIVKKVLAPAARFAAGFLLAFMPYLAFNRLLAGAWWPNTFFAKQAEYAIHQQLPLWRRILAEGGLPLVGAGAVLLPGFVLQVVGSLRRRAWVELAGPLWLGGYLLIYALRLPVTYQHGRYVIPAMPVYFVWALAGMAGWLDLNSPRFAPRLLSRVWLVTLVMLAPVFWGAGARAYALDVAFIETEMVTTAQWVAENIPPTSLVAAHDIGALGYFGQRELLDLAGLVSPEVIPFIRDEDRLAAFLDERGAAFLVTFPDWYPRLVQRGETIYRSPGRFAPQLGGENMQVYRWRPPAAQ